LARNVKFQFVGEMMALLWFGLRGCRTKKGGDAYEEGAELVESEVKTAVGQKQEDFLGSSNNHKVIHLKDDITNLLSQRRWFFVRIIDPLIDLENGKKGGNLKLAIFTLSQENIAVMHRELVRYFSRTDNIAIRGGESSKGYRDDPQFNPSNQFEVDHLSYGWNEAGCTLPMVRIVEFIEKPDDGGQICNVVSEPPEITPCQCPTCQGGGAYWDPGVDRPALGRERVQLDTEIRAIESQPEEDEAQLQLEEINARLEEIGEAIGNALLFGRPPDEDE
jgi:hypothetical protein